MFLCREQDDLYILCTSTLFSLHAPQSGHEEGSIPFAGFWLPSSRWCSVVQTREDTVSKRIQMMN